MLVKELTAPWTIENSNPFVDNLWTPLRPWFEPQETLNPVGLDVPVKVGVTINTDAVDFPHPSRPLLGVTEARNTEPSQIHV